MSIIPTQTEWRHAVTIGDLSVASSGVPHYPAMTFRQDWPGHCAIVDALHLNQDALVRALVRAAASRSENLDQRDQQGFTVLERALVHQHARGLEPGGALDIVPLLLVSGARAAASRFWATVVDLADPVYLKACLKAYPACHPELNRPAPAGCSALHQAAALAPDVAVGAVVRRLIRAGADVQCKDELGRTPWMLARDPAVLAEAVAAKVALDAHDLMGWSVLHHLIARPEGLLEDAAHGVRIQTVLNACPALGSKPDHQGHTPVDMWLSSWFKTKGESFQNAHLAVLQVLLNQSVPWTPIQADQVQSLPGLSDTLREQLTARLRAIDRQALLASQPVSRGSPRQRT